MQPIPISVFSDRMLSVIPDGYQLEVLWQGAEEVVSPREIHEVCAVIDMPKKYLRAVMDLVVTAGDSSVRPYTGNKVDPFYGHPRHIMSMQTFVQSDKLLSLLSPSGLSRIFEQTTGAYGYVQTTAKIILGKLQCGRLVIAHYLPPIIEAHGNDFVLLDGNHRCHIAWMCGSSIQTIIVRTVTTTTPADWAKWKTIQVVNQKPPKEERFHNLRPEFYRDLSFAGVDG